MSWRSPTLVAVIVDYSLAKHTPTGLQLHRLVQAALRARHERTAVAARMTSARSQGDATGRRWRGRWRCLRADAPAAIMGAPEDWPRWAVLLPHVLAATQHWPRSTPSQQVEPDATVWQDCSWLLDRAGTYLQVHGRFVEARPLLERALAITEAVHGPDHPDVATA